MSNTQTLVLPSGSVWQTGWQPAAVTRLRAYIRGPVKSGKSSLIASIPRAAVFDFEDKLRHVRLHGEGSQYFVPQATATKSAFQVFEEEQAKLILDGRNGKRKFDIVVYDTGTELVEALAKPGLTDELRTGGYAFGVGEDVCDYKPSPRGAKGWGVLTNRILYYLRQVYLAGYGWVFVDHEKAEEVQVKQGGQYVTVVSMKPAIHAGLFKGVTRAAEILAKTSVEQTENREQIPICDPDGKPRVVNGKNLTTLKVTTRKTYNLEPEAKEADSDTTIGSNLYLPDKIPLTLGRGWQDFVDAYEAGLAVQQQKGNS